MAANWLYVESTTGTGYTVGFYSDLSENWNEESRWMLKDEAARHVNYLNGGTGLGRVQLEELAQLYAQKIR